MIREGQLRRWVALPHTSMVSPPVVGSRFIILNHYDSGANNRRESSWTILQCDESTVRWFYEREIENFTEVLSG